MSAEPGAGWSIEVQEDPSEEDRAAVLAGLVAYNARFVDTSGERAHRPLGVYVRRHGVIMGGANGYSSWGWLFLAHLWIDDALRGEGVGGRLLAAFEAAGRARGCAAVWLDTFSFQAKPFYVSQGYRQFGELPGYPAGHTRHFLWKPFDEGTEADG